MTLREIATMAKILLNRMLKLCTIQNFKFRHQDAVLEQGRRFYSYG